jgi:hypothetical protein
LERRGRWLREKYELNETVTTYEGYTPESQEMTIPISVQVQNLAHVALLSLSSGETMGLFECWLPEYRPIRWWNYKLGDARHSPWQ